MSQVSDDSKNSTSSKNELHEWVQCLNIDGLYKALIAAEWDQL